MDIAALDPKSLLVLAEKYVQHLMVTRGISRESRKSMRMRLRRFVRFCEERGILYAIDVTRAVLEQYQKFLFHHRQRDNRPLKRKIQNLYLTRVRTLFRWLQKNRLILSD
jgi:integrase/recombinase XerD